MTAPISSLPSSRIVELFSKEPLDSNMNIALTLEERREIVAALREQRGAWAEKEAKPKAPRGQGQGKTSRAKAPRPEKFTLDMLGDLKL